MKNIIFSGTKETGYFLEEYCKDNNCCVKYSDTDYENIDEVYSFLTRQDSEINIISLNNLIDEPTYISEKVELIKRISNSEIIFLASNFEEKSTLVMKLREKGFTKYIFSMTLTKQREELFNALNDITSLETKEVIFDNVYEKIAHDNSIRDNNTFQKSGIKGKQIIAIAGTQERIGTTTQAIQIAKYLINEGYSACYVEHNSSGFTKQCQQMYKGNDKKDSSLGYIEIQHIDMFYKQEKIEKVLSMKYDYYIYDFGSIKNTQFNLISFLEKDIKIIVGGYSPTEFSNTTSAVKKVLETNTLLSLSFIPKADRESIKGIIPIKTSFSEYVPDMFIYNTENNSHYSELINIASKKAKKSSIFFRFIKRNEKYG